MKSWRAAKARRVLSAILKIGWSIKRGPADVAADAKRTGITPDDI